ncbi:Oidioi.mRNA.OKI2018_I69.chr2.g3944.t1.cds [Oikopleura dioica]|uniref:Oidioi.mRNA.OKI2018_I69.chr2.g3944.t1.cds n=1 Tax=Oikopleura dioica TaxID=34765 RepID=A0ABN7SVE1_OIKDI|nr:Oidioi.mRNA.OKI2018_I69.chr2.g3944.t1.cds [Oikopleura dioica]
MEREWCVLDRISLIRNLDETCNPRHYPRGFRTFFGRKGIFPSGWQENVPAQSQKNVNRALDFRSPLRERVLSNQQTQSIAQAVNDFDRQRDQIASPETSSGGFAKKHLVKEHLDKEPQLAPQAREIKINGNVKEKAAITDTLQLQN